LIKDKNKKSKEFHITAYDISDLELNKPTYTLVVDSTMSLFYKWNPELKEYILIITSNKILIWNKKINKIACSYNLKENITDANWHYSGLYFTTLNDNNEIKMIYFDKFEKTLSVLVTIDEKYHKANGINLDIEKAVILEYKKKRNNLNHEIINFYIFICGKKHQSNDFINCLFRYRLESKVIKFIFNYKIFLFRIIFI